MAGTILDDESIPAPHPNCNCTAVKMTRKEYADEYGDPDPEKQEKYEGLKMKEKERKEKEFNIKFEKLVEKVKEREGGYADNPNVIDQPTNIGITQPTLDKYIERHPGAGFSSDLKELTSQRAEQIYKEFFYDEKRIGEINDLRIAYAVMDMGVMTSPKNVGYTVQDSINATISDKVVKDGAIGDDTIKALNSIPENKKDEFIGTLIETRLDFLKSLKDWEKYKGGWTERTNGYMNAF